MSKSATKKAGKKEENVSGYSWTEENNSGKTAQAYGRQDETEKAQKSEQDGYTIAYKDYEYAKKWEQCECNPYKVYNFYGSSLDNYRYGYYTDAPYQSYLTNRAPYNSWRFHHSFYGSRHYYGSRFSIGLSWGNPYSSYYYSPFYRYSYGRYWGRGYHPGFVFNNFYGSGVYYDYDNRESNRNTRYGRRSIGTDRVNVTRNRGVKGRTVNSRRSSASSSGSAVRSRTSVGTSRTGNTGAVRNRGSSGSNNNRGSVRNRGNSQSDNSSSRRIRQRDRSVSDSGLKKVNEQRSRSRKLRNDAGNSNERSTFFNRLKGFFKRSANNLTTGSGSHSTYERSTRSGLGSSSSNSARSHSVGSSTSSSQSSVGRSRSSSGSSSSRSRGGSSGSRSRSGGSDGGSSSSDRSRDR